MSTNEVSPEQVTARQLEVLASVGKLGEGISSLTTTLLNLIELQQSTEIALITTKEESETHRTDILAALEITKLDTESQRTDILAALKTTQLEVESKRIESEHRIRKQTISQFVGIMFFMIVVILVGNFLVLLTQSRASTDRSEIDIKTSEETRIAAIRVQCVASINANWNASFGKLITVGAPSGQPDRESEAYRDSFRKLTEATDLLNNINDICYGPNPNPNPIQK